MSRPGCMPRTGLLVPPGVPGLRVMAGILREKGLGARSADGAFRSERDPDALVLRGPPGPMRCRVLLAVLSSAGPGTVGVVGEGHDAAGRCARRGLRRMRRRPAPARFFVLAADVSAR